MRTLKWFPFAMVIGLFPLRILNYINQNKRFTVEHKEEKSQIWVTCWLDTKLHWNILSFLVCSLLHGPGVIRFYDHNPMVAVNQLAIRKKQHIKHKTAAKSVSPTTCYLPNTTVVNAPFKRTSIIITTPITLKTYTTS